jgi:hypothetical protein
MWLKLLSPECLLDEESNWENSKKDKITADLSSKSGKNNLTY